MGSQLRARTSLLPLTGSKGAASDRRPKLTQTAVHLVLSELARGDQPIISISGKTTTIEPPPETAGSSSRATERKPMSFSFDHSYASYGSKSDADYASQDTLYQDLGLGLLEHAFAGFNTSLYCYGQTGSGKSYSMVSAAARPPWVGFRCAIYWC